MDKKTKERKSPRIVLREPEVLKTIGEESRRNGTDRLTSRQIDDVIKEYRALKKKKQQMKKKQPSALPASRPRRAAQARKSAKPAPTGETLFLSFWNICLDNLPEGTFTHRRITPEEAGQRIDEAHARE